MELLINMTIGGIVTAAVILLIKIILKDRLTPKWHVAIWLVLAVRLLVPGLPESDISVFNAVPKAEHIEVQREAADLVPEGNEAAPTQEDVVQGTVSVKAPFTGTIRSTDFTVEKQVSHWLIFGWAAGVMGMGFFLGGTAAVFGRRVRKLPLCSDPPLLALFEECKKEAGIKGSRIGLRMGGNTPMLVGIRKPAILIPEGYSAEELRYILLHELCHYKNKDNWANIFACLLLTLYWFNPVLWICFFVFRRDLEILCDYRVVEMTGERKAYACVLLKTALRKNPFSFATTSMQNGEKEVEKRIRFLAQFKKPKLWISAGAVMLILVVAALCLTDGTSSPMVIQDAGEGYFLKVPENWAKNEVQDIHDGPESYLDYTVFYDDKGKPFGGIEMLGVEMTAYLNPPGLGQQEFKYREVDYETVELPLGNHYWEVSRQVKEDLLPFPVIIVEVERDSETAAQEAERHASGDLSPSEKIRETHLFFWPNPRVGRVYDLWVKSDKVSKAELLKVAKTFQKEQIPQGAEGKFRGDWEKTAEFLLKDYFGQYVEVELTRASDISGYSIQKIEAVKDREGAWSLLYPNAAVFKVDYTLNVAYPDRYVFAGGGFDIGEGNRTKIFQGELAVFEKDDKDRAIFLGFARPNDIKGIGEFAPVAAMLNRMGMKERAAALIEAQTPYVGDNSKVMNLVGLMPLGEYCSGIELQTETEPYGIKVNYDLTKMGNLIFKDGKEREPEDSRGWGINPYINAQLFQNAAMILSLVDNAGVASLSVQGVSETGAGYTHTYNLDRPVLNEKFVKDARLATKNVQDYYKFLTALEESQLYPMQVIYQVSD